MKVSRRFRRFEVVSEMDETVKYFKTFSQALKQLRKERYINGFPFIWDRLMQKPLGLNINFLKIYSNENN